MKSLLPVLLIVVGLGLGIYGIMQFGDSGKTLEIAGIELGAHDKSQQTQAFLMIGLGVLSLAGGIFMMKKK
ncbi:MAG: LPXTG cell wall anchor domain-containing protein [Lewinellaceae bacterium]|nr:LPXTG cell wall anchor domain-containing protein [Saprospiraceae bacterium]MCB9340339.1 LPXTG cell wall anchor domain-containing protein [Lewinellaceae bacterium]